MGSSEEEAVALKNQGNVAFAAHEWVKAVELYSKAIEIDPTKTAYFSNRAQVSRETQGLPSKASLDLKSLQRHQWT
jgi:serine/threonine-protein phosphatase 5